MTTTRTPTSGAADLRALIEAYAEARHHHGHSSYNVQSAAALKAVKEAMQEADATHLRELAAYRLTVENLEREIAAQRPAPSPAPAGVQWQCGPDMMGIINGLADRAAQADTQPAPVRGIENFPELNMANYGDVEVDRLNNWAFRACAEIDRLSAARAPASNGQAPAQPDPAYSEACCLATALFKRHFAHLPDYASGQVMWGLCDSTAGVISQIDNMVSGLVQPPPTSPKAAQADTQPSPAPATFLRGVIDLCTQKGFSPENIEAWDSNDKWIADIWRQARELLAAQAADSVLYDPKAVLEIFNSARNGSDKPVGYMRGILAVIAHWESRPEPHRWMWPARADSVQEDAARLKEAVGLLEELAEHDSYSTEYDGRMISLCPECGEQEGEHRPNCAFVRAKTFLAARKQGEKQ